MPLDGKQGKRDTQNTYTTEKQKQRIPEGKRTVDWYKKNMEYYAQHTQHYYTRRDKVLTLYRIAQGIMDESWYNYVTNPYATEKKEERRFPAKIRNYDIISPILNLLRGEKATRPFNYQVFVHNADSETKRKKAEKEMILENMKIEYLQSLQAQGYDLESPQEEPPPPPAELVKNFRKSWSDDRADMGQEAIEFLKDDQELLRKWRRGFYDWMVTDRVFSYKDVIRNNVEYDIISSYDIAYIASPDTEYVEDGDAVIRRKWMTISDVIDRFYDTLTTEEIDELEKRIVTDPGYIVNEGLKSGFEPPAHHNRADMVLVEHIVWKGMREIGKVFTKDIFGNDLEFEVDRDFVPRPEDRVEWMWVNEVLEGYRIDEKYYKEMGPIPYQRGTFDNPSKCKLPYNGATYSDRHVESVSLVEKMIPFQILYNIVKYRLEITLAKNKDKIQMMPLGAIPKKKGWDMFTSMYYADATGYMFYDETNPHVLQAMQYMKVLDGSLNQYIKYVYDYLGAIKLELEEFVGINRQRKGQTTASEGKGVTEQSIFQSSIITEELFMAFDEFQRRELQGLLDISKFAWIDGKRAQYVGNDMKVHYLNIEPGAYQESEFGVFVKVSRKENEKLEALRQMAQSFAQNQMRPSAVADILNSENFSQLRDRLEDLEELEMKLNQDAQKAEQQAAQAGDQFKAVEAQKDRDHETIEKEKDRNLERELKYLDTNIEMFNQDANNNQVPDALEAQKLAQEGAKQATDAEAAQRKLDIEEEKNRLKDKEIDSKERTEKYKADTALKNPVVGEKSSKKK